MPRSQWWENAPWLAGQRRAVKEYYPCAPVAATTRKKGRPGGGPNVSSLGARRYMRTLRAPRREAAVLERPSAVPAPAAVPAAAAQQQNEQDDDENRFHVCLRCVADNSGRGIGVPAGRRHGWACSGDRRLARGVAV